MIQSRFPVVLAALFAFAASSASSQMVRSGNVLACDAAKDCAKETIDGQQFYLFQTPQMTVRVAVERDSKYNHIAVMVENRAGFELHVSPSDFRIEVMEPKFKRLSYIEPDKLRLPKIKPAKMLPMPKPALAGSFAATPTVTTQLPSGRAFLGDSTLAPSGTTSGEVFFERSGGSGSLSLILPIGGTIFEIDYTQK